MKILLSLAASSKRASLSEELEPALEWLTTHHESSFNMGLKYLKNSFVNSNILPALYQMVPAPKPAHLYRVLILDKPHEIGSSLVLPPRQIVVSWTESASEELWKQIADDVGILGEANVYVVKTESAIPRLISVAFIKELLKKVKRLKDLGENASYFIESMDPTWQEESIVDGSIPVKVTIVSKLEEI
jgi:hypothetical protein